MADANVGDIYALTYRGTLAAQTIMSTFAYRLQSLDGTPTVVTIYDFMDTLFNDTASNLKDLLQDVLPDNYLFVDCRIQRVATQRIDAKIYDLTPAGGNFGFDATTANLAGVILRRGEVATRKSQSTLHLPYADKETGLANGLVSASYKTVAGALATYIKADKTLPTTTMVIRPVVYNRGSSPNFTAITRTAVQDTLRVMRRRTVGLGI